MHPHHCRQPHAPARIPSPLLDVKFTLQQKQDAQVHLLYAFQFIYFRWSVFVSVGQLLNILVPLSTCITTGKVQKSELNKFNMVYAPT
uniref:Uncharacterized protein n=1 Tax=Triticum urartu TaxID=4572 RepID=A0A8R7QFP5_TRIUA